MYRTLLSLIAVLLLFTAQAQPTHQRVVSELMVTQSSLNPANYVFFDSLHYYYSGATGSTYNYKDYCYNCGNRTVYPDPDYMIVEPFPNNIDVPHSPWARADSSKRYRRGLNGVQEHFTTQVIHYNTDSSVADITRYNFSPSLQDTFFGERSVHEWNGGRLSRVHYLQYDPRDGGWDTASDRRIHYNSAGLVESDSLGMVLAITYTYDAAGRWLTKKQVDYANTPPAANRIDSNVYDAAGRLVLNFHAVTYALAPSGMAYSKDSFVYSPGIAEPTKQYYFNSDYNTGELTDYAYAVLVNRINALGQIDSATTYYGKLSNLGPSSRAYRLRYDARGNPTSKEEWNPNSSSTYPAYITYYGYENYTPPTPTGIRAPVSAPVLSVAPNPGSGAIIIRSTTTIPEGRLQLFIRNTAGQLIRSDEFQLNGGSYMMNPGNELSAGMYLIQIIDARGNSLYSGKIERL